MYTRVVGIKGRNRDRQPQSQIIYPAFAASAQQPRSQLHKYSRASRSQNCRGESYIHGQIERGGNKVPTTQLSLL